MFFSLFLSNKSGKTCPDPGAKHRPWPVELPGSGAVATWLETGHKPPIEFMVVTILTLQFGESMSNIEKKIWTKVGLQIFWQAKYKSLGSVYPCATCPVPDNIPCEVKLPWPWPSCYLYGYKKPFVIGLAMLVEGCWLVHMLNFYLKKWGPAWKKRRAIRQALDLSVMIESFVGMWGCGAHSTSKLSLPESRQGLHQTTQRGHGCCYVVVHREKPRQPNPKKSTEPFLIEIQVPRYGFCGLSLDC